MPAISVITATYNRPHLLPRALDGLVDQTFTDFEVVVVNDAGTDPTPILDRYSDRLDIRLITHQTNQGVGPAQNTAIANAVGEFVCICSDDDRYLPNHLATLHAAALARRGTVPYTDGNQIFEDNNGVVLRRRVLETRDQFSRAYLLVENYLPSLSMLIPRRAFEEVGGAFDPNFEVLEDWDLWLRLSAKFPFVRIPVVTFEYHLRGGANNLTTREDWRFDRCLKRMYAKHPVPPDSSLAAMRAEMLAGSEERSNKYRFDTTIIVRANADTDRLVGALRQIVAAADGQSHELVIIVPRTQSTEALAAQITGDVSFVFTDSDDHPATLGARRAAGRHLHVIEDLSDLGLEELGTAASLERAPN